MTFNLLKWVWLVVSCPLHVVGYVSGLVFVRFWCGWMGGWNRGMDLVYPLQEVRVPVDLGALQMTEEEREEFRTQLQKQLDRHMGNQNKVY